MEVAFRIQAGHCVWHVHIPGLMKTPTRSHRAFVAPSLSPLPCTRGRGVGGEGAWSVQKRRVFAGDSNPLTLAFSPEYRGEGRGAYTCPSPLYSGERGRG